MDTWEQKEDSFAQCYNLLLYITIDNGGEYNIEQLFNQLKIKSTIKSIRVEDHKLFVIGYDHVVSTEEYPDGQIIEYSDELFRPDEIEDFYSDNSREMKAEHYTIMSIALLLGGPDIALNVLEEIYENITHFKQFSEPIYDYLYKIAESGLNPVIDLGDNFYIHYRESNPYFNFDTPVTRLSSICFNEDIKTFTVLFTGDNCGHGYNWDFGRNWNGGLLGTGFVDSEKLLVVLERFCKEHKLYLDGKHTAKNKYLEFCDAEKKALSNKNDSGKKL